MGSAGSRCEGTSVSPWTLPAQPAPFAFITARLPACWTCCAAERPVVTLARLTGAASAEPALSVAFVLQSHAFAAFSRKGPSSSVRTSLSKSWSRVTWPGSAASSVAPTSTRFCLQPALGTT